MIFLTALTAVCLLTVIPNVTAIDCIQCRVRLENEKIVNGDPTGGCLLQPGWDYELIGGRNEDVDVGDGCWRRNELLKSINS